MATVSSGSAEAAALLLLQLLLLPLPPLPLPLSPSLPRRRRARQGGGHDEATAPPTASASALVKPANPSLSPSSTRPPRCCLRRGACASLDWFQLAFFSSFLGFIYDCTVQKGGSSRSLVQGCSKSGFCAGNRIG